MYGRPDEYVTIYCRAESHAGQPWVIATWIPAPAADGYVYWRNSPDLWMNGQFVRRSAQRHGTNRTVGRTAAGDEVLDMDTVDGRARRFEVEQDGKTFGAERLSCHLCGDRMKRTENNLRNDLLRLSDAGMRDVSLTEYRSFVRLMR